MLDFLTQLQKRQEGTDYFCADSKTDLNLHWQCSGKLLVFKSVQDVFTNVDVCMLHICDPQPLECPSTTRGMSVHSSVAVNIGFCGYLQFVSITFV